MSALPLRPFGVPDLVWPLDICEACHQPQWSDALRDWEFVEDTAGPCVACHGRSIGTFEERSKSIWVGKWVGCF